MEQESYKPDAYSLLRYRSTLCRAVVFVLFFTSSGSHSVSVSGVLCLVFSMSGVFCVFGVLVLSIWFNDDVVSFSVCLHVLSVLPVALCVLYY